MKIGDLVGYKNHSNGFIGLVIRIENYPPSMHSVDNSFMSFPVANIIVLWMDGSEDAELEGDLEVISENN